MPSVLITGTSKGIGLETALTFARAGYKVHATMRNPAQSPELAQTAAREKLSLNVSAMDVDSDDSVSSGITQIQKDHGPIDVLVNNAGIDRVGVVEEVPLAEFREAMETNYFGAIRCIQAVVPQMRQRRSGCIINVTSVAGRIANPPMAPLQRVQVGFGSAQRSPGHRNEALQCACGDRRARHHRHRHGTPRWRSRGRLGVSVPRTLHPPFLQRSAEPGLACSGR